MKPRPLPHGIFALALVTLACSLVIDTSEIDAGCGDDMKICAGSCVRIDDPAYGCTMTECSPCEDGQGDPFGDRRLPICNGTDCDTDTCAFGFGCNDCTVPVLSDPANCGSCGNDCDPGWICLLGVCEDPDAIGAGGAD